MTISRGWKRTHQVHVYAGDSACSGWDGVEWSYRLLVDLPTLALLAVSANGAMSLLTPYHTKRAVTIHLVALCQG